MSLRFALSDVAKGFVDAIVKEMQRPIAKAATGAVREAGEIATPIVSGVDVSSLVSRVPSWAWPLVLIATTALFQFLRNLADRRHKAELADASTLAQGE